MIKQLILVVVVLLSSCSLSNEKIENFEPYINVEKTNDIEIVDINIDEYCSIFENKIDAICLLYSSSCSYCQKTIDDLLIPYIRNTKNKIYGLNVYEENNYKNLNLIKNYQPVNNDYYHSENEIRISRPVLQIIYKGEVIQYKKGYSYTCIEMLEKYIKK